LSSRRHALRRTASRARAALCRRESRRNSASFQRLDAEAQTVHARGFERRKRAFGHRFGVRLERDLGSAAIANDDVQASMMRATSAGSRSDGVPPPK